jgi:hypothetical protein
MLYQLLSTSVTALLMMGTENARNMYSDLAIKQNYCCCILLDICVQMQKTMHGTMNQKFMRFWGQGRGGAFGRHGRREKKC